MAMYLWSEEQFPGSTASGRKHEYLQVLGGIIVLVPAAQRWVKLDARYQTPRRHDDWKDLQGHVETHAADEVAEAVVNTYGFRGIVVTEEEPGTEKSKALIAQAKATNLKWRQSVVEDFMSQRKAAELGRPGRLAPTAYEEECFTVLGIQIPSTVESMRTAQAPPVIQVNITPEQLRAAANKAVPTSEDEPVVVGTTQTRRSPGEAPVKGGR